MDPIVQLFIKCEIFSHQIQQHVITTMVIITFHHLVNGEELVGNAMHVNLLLAVGMDEKGVGLSM